MNRQKHIHILLSEYIDGCLSPAATRRVETHLAECAACATELAQLRAVLRLVSKHAAVSCPIDCAEAVMRRIEAGPRRPVTHLAAHPFQPSASLVWASLAAMVLLAGGWGLQQGSRPPAPAAPLPVIAGRPMAPSPAVRVDAPDRLDSAFGHSDSLILASDFAADER